LRARISSSSVLEIAAEAADAAAAAISKTLLDEIRARNEVTPERWVHRKNHLDDIERTLSAT